ncbi:C3H1-type domain-containing protein [Caenorhabditis elegans]|uniref:C3H1-type domain-containing protein n=1 Tax=Caenorhabditis elegans TaxID=6239 RepID=O02174_CAEEL|nr:C3H1-type domain-containing protein [Caenorhabditis elegans]CCD68294.1 C3H1-type domain-containing protein [Caenorhabditis elegans]|eukprot:NP_741720.2 Zinc Finger Protein [Caenorhabditis elegans]
MPSSVSYSPSNPGIRIVKRKPKPEAVAAAAAVPTAIYSGKRHATDDGEDAGLAALKLKPNRGILRGPAISNLNQRGTRRLIFADTRGLPLVHVKEIERIAAIHSNVADYRCSERNEAAAFGQEMEVFEDVEWSLVPVKRSKPARSEMSESGLREERRIEEEGIMRGAMFGMCQLEDNPALNEQAAVDRANYTPTIIPTVSVPSEPTTLATIRDLPLPGRPPRVRPQDLLLQVKPNQGFHTLPLYHSQRPENPRRPMYAQQQQQQSAHQTPTPHIQQVFQETEPVTNYYTATTSVPETPEPAPAAQPASRFELPSNLKEMLNQLKKKGFVSSDETPSPTTSAPPPVDPLAAAMQTAQQMMLQQGNTYASEEVPQDYPMDGYVATFATPEMMAQERRQDSRNSEGWTQSGWKIPEPCVYFISRPGGCNRGDQCRFIHDEEMRRQKMAELPPRGPNHHHDNFRGGRGRGFRGGYNNRNNYNNHHDRDFRDNAGGNRGRFGDTEGFRGARYARGGFAPRNNSRFDQKPAYNDDGGHLGSPNAHGSQYQDPVPTKRARVSRFDRQGEDDAPGQDMDQRPPRRNRFDEQPPRRTFRSRFDQQADHDEMSQA